jgi:hypothetical protein
MMNARPKPPETAKTSFAGEFRNYLFAFNIACSAKFSTLVDLRRFPAPTTQRGRDGPAR